MNRATLFLLGSLMVLLNCSAARGQGCGTTLVPEFSVYTSSSRDGYNIYTSVTIQGYANVYPNPGCQMNRATHHVGAENKLNNVDHWTYSANGCPSCYFSATDNESLLGVPGVTYPWEWDGQAICSIVGPFYNGGGGGSLPGCLAPSSESTQFVRVDPQWATVTDFNQSISDTAGDSFDGLTIQEDDAATAQDTCWGKWSNVPQVTGVTGGFAWTVAGTDVPGQHNHWGFDEVGWKPGAVAYYRTQDPAHGIAIPCGYTVYQALKISCPSGLTATYTPSYGNKLTGTIEQTDVINCRYDMNNTSCQTITY